MCQLGSFTDKESWQGMLEKEKSHGKTKKNSGSSHADHGSHGHPDHSVHIKRLNRVKGQIEGIEKMILDRRYCPDIIAQLKAASAALRAVEAEVFKSHLRGCVKSAFNGDDAFKSEEKIQEIIKMVF
jgi:DNA-binding FrmR family transcriptional regulator